MVREMEYFLRYLIKVAPFDGNDVLGQEIHKGRGYAFLRKAAGALVGGTGSWLLIFEWKRFVYQLEQLFELRLQTDTVVERERSKFDPKELAFACFRAESVRVVRRRALRIVR